MQLTGRQIVEEGIITNYVAEAVQQQGIDIRLATVDKLGGAGTIPKLGKTKLPIYTRIEPQGDCWMLQPGYYQVTFFEGCRMPKNRVMVFISRSSLVRCGAQIVNGQFDAGFETDSMGCFLQVLNPICIEVGARIAQTRILETEDVENLYNGQYQHDKQR